MITESTLALLIPLILIIAAFSMLSLAFKALRHARIIEDTPTAKIRSAAQGYNEFFGMGKQLPGIVIKGALTKQPCIWYSYEIQKSVRHEKEVRWKTIHKGKSKHLMYFEDGTGGCIIDPEGASVVAEHTVAWKGFSRKPSAPPDVWWKKLLALFGNYRYIERQLLAEENLYVIGMFNTKNKNAPELAEWHEKYRNYLSNWQEEKINIVNNHDMPARRPFLLSCKAQEKVIKEHRHKAIGNFIAFIIFIALAVITATHFHS